MPALRQYFDIKQQLIRHSSNNTGLHGSRDQGLNSNDASGNEKVMDKEELLAQVRRDNGELGLIERKIAEVREEMAQSQLVLGSMPSDAGTSSILFSLSLIFGCIHTWR